MYLKANYTSTHTHYVSVLYANASCGFETDITYLACIHVVQRQSLQHQVDVFRLCLFQDWIM